MKTDQWICTVSAALAAFLVLSLTSAAAAQDARYLKHDGADIAAKVNEASGTPYWVIDVDKLQLTPEPTTLESEGEVRSASDQFLERYSDFSELV